MKKSEKEAKDKLRRSTHSLDSDHVTVVNRKGARLEYNEGQAVKQKFGSGVKDIVGFLSKKK